MRTWTSLVMTLAAATALSAYADDRTSTTTDRTGSSTGSSMSTDSSSTPSSTSRPATTPGATATGDRHDMSHGTAGSMSSAKNDPELQNLTNDKFVQKAGAAGMKEVQAAELALRNSKNEQVKSFAREMVSDHTKANNQLATLASQNNLQVPTTLPAKDKEELDKLRAQTGTSFDTAFAQQMKLDHEKAVALFQSCAEGSKLKADVRKFCQDTLPTLEEHHQAANALDSKSNTTRAASTDE
jgi:putative membrane protein